MHDGVPSPDAASVAGRNKPAKILIRVAAGAMGSSCMADESGEILRQARVRARQYVLLALLLAGISCVVFLIFLVLLYRAVQQDPLAPLRDISFSIIGVGINFALALGSVVAFGYWRRIQRARAGR
jgi:hypothetical protein